MKEIVNLLLSMVLMVVYIWFTIFAMKIRKPVVNSITEGLGDSLGRLFAAKAGVASTTSTAQASRTRAPEAPRQGEARAPKAAETVGTVSGAVSAGKDVADAAGAGSVVPMAVGAAVAGGGKLVEAAGEKTGNEKLQEFGKGVGTAAGTVPGIGVGARAVNAGAAGVKALQAKKNGSEDTTSSIGLGSDGTSNGGMESSKDWKDTDKELLENTVTPATEATLKGARATQDTPPADVGVTNQNGLTLDGYATSSSDSDTHDVKANLDANSNRTVSDEGFEANLEAGDAEVEADENALKSPEAAVEVGGAEVAGSSLTVGTRNSSSNSSSEHATTKESTGQGQGYEPIFGLHEDDDETKSFMRQYGDGVSEDGSDDPRLASIGFKSTDDRDAEMGVPTRDRDANARNAEERMRGLEDGLKKPDGQRDANRSVAQTKVGHEEEPNKAGDRDIASTKAAQSQKHLQPNTKGASVARTASISFLPRTQPGNAYQRISNSMKMNSRSVGTGYAPSAQRGSLPRTSYTAPSMSEAVNTVIDNRPQMKRKVLKSNSLADGINNNIDFSNNNDSVRKTPVRIKELRSNEFVDSVSNNLDLSQKV